MEKTNKLTANQKEIIMQNPKVKAFDGAVTRLENASRIAGVQIACLVYTADHDGTAAAMGLASAADYLQQVRKYSKSQAMNMQRVGRFLKGKPENALDSNGNAISMSAMVQLLESCDSEEQASKFIADGTVNALTPVKKLKKQIDKLNGREIVANAESKEVDGDSDNATPDSADKTPADVYTIDIAVTAPDGNGGAVTVKSENFNGKLCVIQSHIEKLIPMATAPGAKVVVTVTPRK
jgi:hypothetical protein|nr:MAG TPA: hypothetical protein [Caudoviricetes sp.]